MHQSLLRGIRRRSISVVAVHDEIKPERGRNPFLGHGVLFVPEDWVHRLMDGLQTARKECQYYDEVKYRDVKEGTPADKVFQVAQRWFWYYFTYAIHGCPFKAFISEDSSIRRFPYPGDPGWRDHLSESMLSSFVAGIRWSFYRENMMRVRMVFDDSDNEVDRDVASFLPARLQHKCNWRRLTRTKRYPHIRVAAAEFVSSNPREVASDQWELCEFTQLCDLFLGAIYDALRLRAKTKRRKGRLVLASSIGEAMAETLQLPWLQRIPVHRRFSVSLYPDEFNFAYPAALRAAKARSKEDAPLPGFEEIMSAGRTLFGAPRGRGRGVGGRRSRAVPSPMGRGRARQAATTRSPRGPLPPSRRGPSSPPPPPLPARRR